MGKGCFEKKSFGTNSTPAVLCDFPNTRFKVTNVENSTVKHEEEGDIISSP